MIRFLSIGDWGRRGSEAQRAVAAGMARVAGADRLDFIVSTGDNFYDEGVVDLDDDHFRESFEEVYGASSLAAPWYAVLGNHDYRGSIEAQDGYTRRSRRWRMPAPHYGCRFDIEPSVTALFAFLDTTPFLDRYHPGGSEFTPAVLGVDTEAQLRWLENLLDRSTDAWRVVVGHHPVFSGSPFHGAAPEFSERLRPLLSRYGVQAYLCGHEHDLQHLVADGVHYFVTGAGSECRRSGTRPESRFCHGGLGFLAASLDAERLEVSLHDVDGMPVHTVAVGRDGRAVASATTAGSRRRSSRLERAPAR